MLEAVKKRLSHKISLTLAGVMVLLTIGVAIFIIQNQERMMEEFTLDKAKLASILGANMYGTVLEEAIDNDVITVTEAFDHEYELIRGYNWGDKPKFHTKYDFLTDKAVIAFQDKFLDTKDFVFAIGVDKNGYVPTHNSRYQQPITGDLEKDLVGNRTKRRFDDPVGKAAAQNTEPGYIQEYRRDTGELMWDVSSPVYVKGKHWGGFRIAVSIGQIENHKNALLWYLIFLFGGFALVVIGTNHLLIKRATKPIEILSATADKISMGKGLDEKLDSDSTDEIGTLTKSIDRLRASMKAAMDRPGK
jgi:methyl-accepting chemotaxis protein